MRMTNKIMRNNSAYNINQNKILQDRLTNQMTTQSKIVRPSDDPVVAIRALRLRSNVTTVSQYNDKNAKDADQWLALTADAMDTVDQVLTDLYEQATAAPNKYHTSNELRILLSQMKQLTSEFYSCANVDYAGRFVFSGYRTDLPVTFTEEDMKDMKDHRFLLILMRRLALRISAGSAIPIMVKWRICRTTLRIPRWSLTNRLLRITVCTVSAYPITISILWEQRKQTRTEIPYRQETSCASRCRTARRLE